MGINSKYVISFKIFPCSFSSILNDSWVSNSVLKLYTDSAGGVSKGCGIYFDGKWACLN
jgi:hypothetical protein